MAYDGVDDRGLKAAFWFDRSDNWWNAFVCMLRQGNSIVGPSIVYVLILCIGYMDAPLGLVHNEDGKLTTTHIFRHNFLFKKKISNF